MIVLYLALSVASAGPVLALDLESPPAAVELSPAETAALIRGETVYRYAREDGVERGLSVTLVQASPGDIWPHVLDYDAYVRFLPYVTASTTEGVREVDGGEVHECTLELTTKGITTRYLVHNHWLQASDRVGFTMASRSGAPVKGGVGWWSTGPWPGDPSRTLLTYQVALDLSWYVPAGFKRRAAPTGLPRLAALIARRAEASPEGAPGTEAR